MAKAVNCDTCSSSVFVIMQVLNARRKDNRHLFCTRL